LPKADLPFPIDLQWYEARDLDTYPRALLPIDAVYPTGAAADNARGMVVLLLSIDEHGSVHEAAVVSAEPAGYFEASALSAAHAATFAAGQKDGHNVRSKLIVKLRFAPQEQAAR
jgi:periplasmic protein TonB